MAFHSDIQATRDRRCLLLKWMSRILKDGSTFWCQNYKVHVKEEASVSFCPPYQGEYSGAEDRLRQESMHFPRLKEPSGYRKHGNGGNETAKENHDLLDPLACLLYPSPPVFPSKYRFPLCSGCNGIIGPGDYLSFMGHYFHQNCLHCHSCGSLISEPEFCLSGGIPYHKFCFKELTHPRCDVCYQFVPASAAGLIEYRRHPYWSQKYCPIHELDNTPRCCSCERLQSLGSSYHVLEDGRHLCSDCMETAIMNTENCQQLYHSLRDYYEGLNMKLDQQIPMILVERQALNDAIIVENNGFNQILPETRGLCLSEVQTVSNGHKKHTSHCCRLLEPKSHRRNQSVKCEVIAILVLYGLPRLLTGAILAHELMHAWLRLNGFSMLNHEVEEGICQLLSHVWLDRKWWGPACHPRQQLCHPTRE